MPYANQLLYETTGIRGRNRRKAEPCYIPRVINLFKVAEPAPHSNARLIVLAKRSP